MTSKPSRRALFLINPNARHGRDSTLAARTTLRDGGLALQEANLGEGETVSEAIMRCGKGCDLVIVGGGDGTLNAASRGIEKTGLSLGVLPMGTANDFARTLEIPTDPVAAAKVILAGQTRSVDLGDVNGQPFLNVASIGFSAELAAELTASAKKYLGKLGYGVVAARLLARSQLFTAYLEHDGQIEQIKTLQVSIGNGKYYGGGMTIEKDAAPDDGMLDFYSLEVGHWWRLLSLLPSLKAGTHAKWGDVRSFRTNEVIVKTRRPRPVNTDGELTTTTPARFTIRPEAIRVFAPLKN